MPDGTNDVTSLLITASFAALIRLIDAWIALEAGLPLDALQPASLDDLDAEAKRYVDQIIADRREATEPQRHGEPDKDEQD